MRSNDYPTAREHAWAVMQTLDTFTVDDLTEQAEISGTNAAKLIYDLRQSGHVEVHQERNGTPGSRHHYHVVRRSRHTPRAVVQRPDWRKQAWSSIRIKRRFTAYELKVTMTADVSLRTVQGYLRLLDKAGYICKVGRNAPPGTPMSHLIYQLVRDTGPDYPTRRALLCAIQEDDDTGE